LIPGRGSRLPHKQRQRCAHFVSGKRSVQVRGVAPSF